MYLLDTNVVSEFRRPRPHGAVVAWLGSVREPDLFVSAATLGELQAGVEKMRMHDPSKADEIGAWIDEIAEGYQVLDMDGRAFRGWARLLHRRSGNLSGDAMIAATAQVHDLTVVTRNLRDFQDFPVRTLDPFAYR